MEGAFAWVEAAGKSAPFCSSKCYFGAAMVGCNVVYVKSLFWFQSCSVELKFVLDDWLQEEDSNIVPAGFTWVRGVAFYRFLI